MKAPAATAILAAVMALASSQAASAQVNVGTEATKPALASPAAVEAGSPMVPPVKRVMPVTPPSRTVDVKPQVLNSKSKVKQTNPGAPAATKAGAAKSSAGKAPAANAQANTARDNVKQPAPPKGPTKATATN